MVGENKMLQWNGNIFGPYSGMVETVHFETMGCKFHKQKWLYKSVGAVLKIALDMKQQHFQKMHASTTQYYGMC